MFVSFEGPDGGGKTTQVRCLAAALRAAGQTVHVVHEPGTTHLGEEIRRLLLGASETPLSARAEALLFAAARAQLVEEVIRPSLARGEIVLADRFSDSTVAYQAAGRGLPRREVEELINFATNGLQPDLTFLLDLDAAAGLARKERRRDRLEQEPLGFHQTVRNAYLDLARRQPERIIILDGTRPPEVLAARIWETVQERRREITTRARRGVRYPQDCQQQEGESAP